MATRARQPFPAGTFTGGAVQTIGTIAQNQWAESCWTFSYKNTFPAGRHLYRTRAVHADGAVRPSVGCRHAYAHLLAFCIIWLVALPAIAKTTVIDDSGTLPNNAALNMRWQQVSPRGPDANTMVGTLRLRVKLNVAPWHEAHRAAFTWRCRRSRPAP